MRPRPFARRRSSTSRRATGCCSRSCCGPSTRAYTRAKDRESAVDFEDLQLLARDLARARTRPRAGAALSLPLDHGGRVPGHEPAPVRARRPRLGEPRRPCRAGAGALLRRRRVPVDLPVPPRGRRRLPGAAGRERGSARADARTTARVRRCSTSSTIFSVAEFGERFAPLEAGRPLSRADFGLCGRAARHRQAELPGGGASAGGSREARHVARRVRELVDARRVRSRARSCSCSRPGRAPRRTRRRFGRKGLPTYRAAGRGYFGQQQVVDLLAYLRLLHNRYDDEALAHGARVAARRGVERRARPAPARGRPAAPLLAASSRSCRRACRSATGAGSRPSGSATTASSGSRWRPGSSACASGSSPSTTTTSRFSRTGTDGGATRTSEARAAGALVRGAARPRPRGVRPLRPRSGGASAHGRSRPSPRRRAPRRCAC